VRSALSLALAPLLLPLGLALGCTHKGGGTTDDTGLSSDGGGYTSVDTSAWVDTAADGGASDGGAVSDDTGDTAPVGPVATALALYPTRMDVGVGATWSTRLLATWDDGTVSEADASWQSGNVDVVEVDASGQVRALAAGDTTVRAERDGLLVTADVHVRDDGMVTVTVVDAESGLPHAGAHVRLGTDDAEGMTDEAGRIELEADGSVALVVSAWDHYRVPVTAYGVMGRSLTLPIRSPDDVSPAMGDIRGNVDLDGVPTGGGGDIKIGIAAPSLGTSPLLVDPALLVGPPREITLYGVTANVPANIYVRSAAEDYDLPSAVGTTGIWTVAAPLAISDVTSGLAGATDALSLMLADLDKVVWGWSDGATVAAGETGRADLAPATPLSEALTVDAGPLPVGFSGTEQALVLVGDMLPAQGFSPTGLGVGRNGVDVHAAPLRLDGTTGRYATAVAQVGGLGSGTGHAVCTSWAPMDGDEVTLPEFQQVPMLNLFDVVSKDFTLQTDARARMVHITIFGGGEGEVRDIVMDGGPVEGTLLNFGSGFGYGSTSWEIAAFETWQGTYEDMVRDGWPTDTEIARGAWTAGLLTQEP